MLLSFAHLSRRSDDVTNGHEHDILHLQQPLLDRTARLRRADRLAQLHALALAREHGVNVENAVELQLADACNILDTTTLQNILTFTNTGT